MPSFFQFTQGTESRVRPTESSPLLGRFRAVPPRPGLGRRRSSPLDLIAGRLAERGSVHVGYGAAALAAAGLTGDDDDDSESDEGLEDGMSKWGRVWQRWVIDLWVDPRQAAVKRVVSKWWTRYGVLVFLPAALVRAPPETGCPLVYWRTCID